MHNCTDYSRSTSIALSRIFRAKIDNLVTNPKLLVNSRKLFISDLLIARLNNKVGVSITMNTPTPIISLIQLVNGIYEIIMYVIAAGMADAMRILIDEPQSTVAL